MAPAWGYDYITLELLQPSLPQWFPISCDADSIEIIDVMSSADVPSVFLPGNGNAFSQNGSSILPMVDFYNAWSLIGEAQILDTGTVLDLLEVENLAKSTKTVFMEYTKQILQVTIPGLQFAAYQNISAPTKMTTYYSGIKQAEGTTVAIIILLFAVFLCVGHLFITTPRRTILPKKPSSIAAQMSFLAGSTLVRRLREENVTTTKDTTIWDEKFGLGWWFAEPHSDELKSKELRWGIDVGIPVSNDTGLRRPMWIKDSSTHHVLNRPNTTLVDHDVKVPSSMYKQLSSEESAVGQPFLGYETLDLRE